MEELKKQYPDKKLELWCQDESRIGQKGRRTHSWALKGSRPLVPIDTRYENMYIYGAFCPERDLACGLILPYANTEMMQLHLNEITKEIEPDSHALMIIDGAGWHRSDKLNIPENITFIQTPPSSPQCNPAEKPWQFLKDNFLSQCIFETCDDITNACLRAWNKMSLEIGRIRSLTDMKHLICQHN